MAIARRRRLDVHPGPQGQSLQDSYLRPPAALRTHIMPNPTPAEITFSLLDLWKSSSICGQGTLPPARLRPPPKPCPVSLNAESICENRRESADKLFAYAEAGHGLIARDRSSCVSVVSREVSADLAAALKKGRITPTNLKLLERQNPTRWMHYERIITGLLEETPAEDRFRLDLPKDSTTRELPGGLAPEF